MLSKLEYTTLVFVTMLCIVITLISSVGFSVAVALNIKTIINTRPMNISIPSVPLTYVSFDTDVEIEPLPEPTMVSEVEDSLKYFDVPLDKELQNYIFELCEDAGIDPSIVIAMIGRESTYRDYIVGDSGRSYGLMQIQSRWHTERMARLGCDNLLDPYQNVAVGIDYLAELMGRGQGIEWALMAYNGGPSYANRKTSQGIVSDYALGILAESQKLLAKS